MNNQQIIINARLIGESQLQTIFIGNQEQIIDILPSHESSKIKSENILDLQGDWLSLGGVDLQINGALGLAFPDLEIQDFAKLDAICNFLWNQGIDGFCPTIVTTSIAKIQRSLTVLEEFIRHQSAGAATANILGVHLEGPFLNQEKRGAHPQQYLLDLTLDNLKKVIGKYQSIIKIITLAPELDPTFETIDYLKSQNIIISLGHSLATATQAAQAFDQGASMVTHAFNAMPSLHHRQPGLLGAAINNPQVFCGLIADGNHVCPTMMQILLKASDGDRGIFLVSDALSPIGLPDGVYPWDERTITVTNGTARLDNETLAGTTLPLLVGVQNLVKWGICKPETAIAMATNSPRKAIAMSETILGKKAHLLRWSWNKKKSNLSWSRICSS
ncbi:N-acetylglucosamine-6-phosphate deacetylase [Xenococcus sp. PCC 7305]|uniref:N-acetylglucosamine-6-phosphate deacetylase n=1 Tax=Xenococcus sp. PCC 7305 TaxID=102125 RepID=UPI0002ACE6BA|nr:N-acetylglucosamine-6-phosphate deacetylase [Xenococcus sp. PCC 7305]ELS02464.1 N-acetylglucosamine-6-phosphate deacetylase [Xenococcus sp. PCC 7305]